MVLEKRTDWLTEVLRGTTRAVQTLGILGRAGLGWVSPNRPPAPVMLRQTFEALGTTYIKLGQFVASSPSLFPDEYVEEFQKCLDNTDYVPFHIVRGTIEAELGKPVSELFAWLDPVPLASASIAQVHAARLHSGDSVVVKVQKPGVRNIIVTDFNFLFIAARVAEWLAPGVSHTSLTGIIEELQASMLEECDFLKEARNLDRFNAFLADTGNEQVVAPRPYHSYSSMRVLTMERFFGVPLTDIQVLRQYTHDPAATLVTALNTWFSSLMLCDFFHADVHAGNLMLLKDGRVGFIDFGIVGHIRRDTWDAMARFLDAIGRGDTLAMAQSMMTIGMTHATVDVAALARDIDRFQERLSAVEPSSLMEGSVNEREVNRLLLDLVRIGEQHGIRFPREFALLLKQFLYFDRYVQVLAPEMDVFNDERIDVWGALEEIPGGLLH